MKSAAYRMAVARKRPRLAAVALNGQVLVLAFLSSVLLPACGDPKASREPFDITLQASADDGRPLPGVSFALARQSLGVTGASGRLRASLRGSEGQAMTITPTCPANYAAPAAVPLRLTRLRDAADHAPKPLLLDVTCTRNNLELAIVVRVGAGTEVPVRVRGETATRTNSDGLAHFALTVPREQETLELVLDTSHDPLLQPPSPRRVFELHNRDAVLIFDQPLRKSARKKAPSRSRHVPARHIPYKVQ